MSISIDRRTGGIIWETGFGGSSRKSENPLLCNYAVSWIDDYFAHTRVICLIGIINLKLINPNINPPTCALYSTVRNEMKIIQKFMKNADPQDVVIVLIVYVLIISIIIFCIRATRLDGVSRSERLNTRILKLANKTVNLARWAIRNVTKDRI